MRHLSRSMLLLAILIASPRTALADPGCPGTWQCLPGLSAPIRLLDDDIQCASTDGRNCLWGACPTTGAPIAWQPAARPAHLIPLICGPDHAAKHGSTGYDTAGHWCREACQRLGCGQIARPVIAPPPPPGQVILFRDARFAGAWQAMGLGNHDMAELSGGIGNDQLSSLRVPRGFAVTVFEHAGFQGRARTFVADVPWLGDDLNDQVSSLIVSSAADLERGKLETVRLPDNVRTFTNCPRGTRWGCQHVTQGIPPPPDAPQACGCIPECPGGLFLMTRYAGGTWPDGSPRAAFSCSPTLPP